MKLLALLMAPVLALTACKQQPKRTPKYDPNVAPLPVPTPTPDEKVKDETTGVVMPVPSLKIAFVGDQGVSPDSHAVLKLIKDEKTDLLVIPGDFDYEDKPEVWNKMLTDTVGDMPIIGAIGNHDLLKWKDYAAILEERLGKMPKAKCQGEIGVKHNCLYEGIHLVVSGVGTRGDKHEAFLEESLASSKAAFKICVWHKNQHLMQAGHKADEVGWPAYEICRKHGAIVATAHEHSYARTHLLSNFEMQSIADTDELLTLEPGKSFAFVSGLGGKSVREAFDDSSILQKVIDRFKGIDPNSDPGSGAWWGNVYTGTQDATYGALFCTFNVENNPRRARCYFKNIKGETVDGFDLESKLHAT